MKKSTVGMVLLVAMVLTKAFLVEGDRASDGAVERTSMNLDDADELLSFRTEHEQEFQFSPTINLLVANINTPEIVVRSQVNNEIGYEESNDVAAIESVEPEREVTSNEEIIPMDYISDTGYGMWRTTTEKIKSVDEREGKVPLDRGSTITDNISRLFPRVP